MIDLRTQYKATLSQLLAARRVFIKEISHVCDHISVRKSSNLHHGYVHGIPYSVLYSHDKKTVTFDIMGYPGLFDLRFLKDQTIRSFVDGYIMSRAQHMVINLRYTNNNTALCDHVAEILNGDDWDQLKEIYKYIVINKFANGFNYFIQTPTGVPLRDVKTITHHNKLGLPIFTDEEGNGLFDHGERSRDILSLFVEDLSLLMLLGHFEPGCLDKVCATYIRG